MLVREGRVRELLFGCGLGNDVGRGGDGQKSGKSVVDHCGQRDDVSKAERVVGEKNACVVEGAS